MQKDFLQVPLESMLLYSAGLPPKCFDLLDEHLQIHSKEGLQKLYTSF